jgi:hypothetical protein
MIRMIMLVLLCTLVKGQDSPAREAPQLGRQTGPFRFSLSADKLLYQPDETITVTSVLRNETDHDLSISMTPRLTFYSMEVMLPGSAWIPFRNRAVLSEEGQRRKFPGFISATSHILEPRGEFVDKFELNKLYTMPVPGEYYVKFYFHAPDYVGKGIYVVSNVIAVTIAEKK